MSRLLVLVILSLLAGCSLLPKLPKITTGKTRVVGPANAGSPTQVREGESNTSFDVPAGTEVTSTSTEATPATASTPFLPARHITRWTFATPTKFNMTTSMLDASTGTVDTSVAKHQIDTESRKPLLYCAIGAAVAGLGFMYVRFSSIAVMCFLAAGTFFMAWRMSEISPWLGGLLLTAAVAGFAFYKRAEWDKDGDGKPDFLQRKPPGQ